MLHRLLLLLSLLLAFTSVRAETQVSAQVSDGWIRLAPPTAKVMAGYLTIDNTGSEDLVISEVRSADFGAIEIHEMTMQDGVMRMRRVAELRVPAGGKVTLEPGGLHLMLFRPQRRLPEGSKVGIRLMTDGGELKATIEVRAAAT
jgi:periplasmic copper chaperone A